ncbi:hypothetical protein XENTR_v10010896 [Xenopus tropicalis]|nr:hypothetical protein XENTR_v10010896 [Xenopus tropicalis]
MSTLILEEGSYSSLFTDIQNSYVPLSVSSVGLIIRVQFPLGTRETKSWYFSLFSWKVLTLLLLRWIKVVYFPPPTGTFPHSNSSSAGLSALSE